MTIFILVVCSVALLLLLALVFWPRRKPEPSAENNWQQRDGTEMPSLDGFSAPQTLSDVDVGLGAQNGGPR